MKYATIFLRDPKDLFPERDLSALVDAFTLGGVFMDEVCALPFSRFAPAVERLSAECDGLFVLCPPHLWEQAGKTLSALLGKSFVSPYLLDGEGVTALIPVDGNAADLIGKEMIPIVNKKRNNRYDRVIMKMMRVPADLLERTLQEARALCGNRLVLHVSEKFGDYKLELIYDASTPKMLADDVVRLCASAFADYLYAMEDVSIASRLVDALKLHGKRVSTAESFTGGGVGSAIAAVPGASKVYFEGLNTYDSDAKKLRLGVSDFTLSNYGAVSEQTAYEMAGGLISQGRCQLSIATTGLAGPSSDGTNPVGLCFIAIGTTEKVRIFRYRLDGDRETITKTGINIALFLAYREIAR